MPAALPDRDLLARLVVFDSVSARPVAPIAAFACEYLERPGARVARVPAGEGKLNVLASIGPEPSPRRAGLVLSGHLDVVPADEPGWSGDPFRMREANGRCYGRGACDMKGFLALAMNAFAEVEPGALGAPLVLILTCDEELGSLGAQRLASGALDPESLPRSAVIGEPTELRVVRMHKGHLRLRLTVPGRRAHTGSPHLGRNAIERAGRVLEGLRRLRVELETERLDTNPHFAAVPFAVLAATRIDGGVASNVVPDRCVIDVGVRLLPGGDSAAMIGRVAEVARAVVHEGAGTAVDGNEEAGADDEAIRLDVLNDNPPMRAEASAAVHRRLCALTGQEGSHGVSFASDAGVFQRDLGMECVLFGPGSIEVAHRPDEFVPVADLERAAGILRRLIRDMCETGDA